MKTLELPRPPIRNPEAVRIEETREISPEITEFLDNVRWGTQGVFYTVNNHRDILSSLPGPLFMLLRKNERLIAMRMMLGKSIHAAGKTYPAFYHSLFSVDSQEKGKGYGKTLARATLDRMRALLGPRGLIYAYVEAGNERSFQITESLGYKRIGRFYANQISRLSPMDSSRVHPLQDNEVSLMKQLLENHYADHALTDFDVSLKPENYWTIDENGVPLAGVQAKFQQWKMESLGGVGGQMAVHVVPHIPVLGRLFNPMHWRFLKLGNLYARPGCEGALYELIEALLHRFQVTSAMAYFDHRSPVYERFRSAGRFGLLNRLMETEVKVYGYFHGLSSREIFELHNRPLVISPLDI